MPNRRGAAIAGLIAVIAAIIFIVALRPISRYYVIYGAFDTEFTLTATTRTPRAFNRAAKALESRITQLGAEFDAFHAYSGINNVKTINDNAESEAVVISDELFRLLEFGKAAYGETGGAVDITIGSVTNVWRGYAQGGLSPNAGALAARGRFAGIDKLVLDETAKTAYLKEYGTALDVGAIAKGYAAQMAADELSQYLNNFILNAGGNVICYGEKTYTVGVMNPGAADGTGEGAGEGGAVFAALRVTNKAVVTSGDYERFYIVDGESYCHIIDPATLYPPRLFRSVTVIADDSAVADMLSTALFIKDEQAGRALLDAYGADALWIYPDGSYHYTKGVVFQ